MDFAINNIFAFYSEPLATQDVSGFICCCLLNNPPLRLIYEESILKVVHEYEISEGCPFTGNYYLLLA